MSRVPSKLSVQVRAGLAIVALAAGDVGINIVEASGEVADILTRLARDGSQHGGGELVVLADILEHSATPKEPIMNGIHEEQQPQNESLNMLNLSTATTELLRGLTRSTTIRPIFF